MARMEFAILHFLEGNKKIALRREQDQVLERLIIRIRENIGNKPIPDDAVCTWNEVEAAIEKAFNGLVKEFMDETITLV